MHFPLWRTTFLLAIVSWPVTARAEPVDFNRDIRPILSRHCFKCHGPDDQARKARLRLDRRENAVAEARSGARPVVPGNPEESELIRRIFATEETQIMPPPAANNPLSAEQKQLLQQWIAAGADSTPLGVRSTSPGTAAPRQADRLAAQRHRLLRARPVGGGWAAAFAARRPLHPRAPPLAGPDRPTAHTAGGRRLRPRPRAERV